MGFIGLYLSIENKIKNGYEDCIWKLVPGKQLLSLYICYLNSMIGKKHLDKSDFENISAHTCDLTSFSFLKRAIYNYLEYYQESIAG